MKLKRVQNKLECSNSRNTTWSRFKSACLQTVLRPVTLIKARWLKHGNIFGLGSSLSLDQTIA